MTKIIYTLSVKEGVHDNYPAFLIHIWYSYSFSYNGVFFLHTANTSIES